MGRPGGKKLQAQFAQLRTNVARHCQVVQPGIPFQDPKLSLEEVFSAHELARDESRSTPEQAAIASDAIRELKEAIRLATFAYGRGDAKKYRPNARGNVASPYAELLEKLFKTPALSRAHVLITFNYDICLDRCVINLRGASPSTDLDYSIPLSNHRVPGAPSFAPPNPNAAVVLLRTHGSLNWIRCGACQSVFTTVNRHAAVTEASQCWSCQRQRLDYVLVHPSYLRSYSDPLIQIIWGRCQEELVSADRWIFVGYSLPPADVHFRELLRDCLRQRDRMSKPTTILAVGSGPLNTTSLENYSAIFESRVEAWNATAEGFADFVRVLDP